MLCSVWANYNNSFMSHLIVSYNNTFIILHRLHICDVGLGWCNEPVERMRKCNYTIYSDDISLLNYTKDGLWRNLYYNSP